LFVLIQIKWSIRLDEVTAAGWFETHWLSKLIQRMFLYFDACPESIVFSGYDGTTPPDAFADIRCEGLPRFGELQIPPRCLANRR
jgi:hypothetical protein